MVSAQSGTAALQSRIARLRAWRENNSGSEGGGRSIRDRLIEAAVQYTLEHGWSAVTMAKLADKVGVSRQTVYNELGAKPELAEAIVMSELAEFLRAVDTAFADHPDDLVEAIRAAALGALRTAQTNPLLRAVVASSQGGGDSSLLPFLTTQSRPVLEVAGQVIRAHIDKYDNLGLPSDRLDGLIDGVIRLVLSHIMNPSDTPEATADTLAWLASQVLQGTTVA